MTTITNLEQFFESRGFGMGADGMYQYGRALYKGSCGVWISYMYEDRAPQTIEYTMTIRPNAEGYAAIDSREGIPERVLDFFSMSTIEDDESRYEFNEFYQILVNYVQRETGGIGEWEYSKNKNKIIITGSYTLPGLISDVYYEDDTAKVCTETMADKVIGIKVGSIIEGADYDATPFELYFPFDSDGFNSCMEELESEVDLEWHKNNTTYFSLTNRVTGEKAYFGEWVAFADEPTGTWGDDPVIKEIAIAGGEMVLESAGGEISGFPGWWVDEEIMDF